MTKLKGKLNRSSPEPLYRQLAELLAGEIGSGRLRPGSQLDSEEQLTRRFQVSRITVRQAIEELARRQVLVRKQGKGTFVTRPPVRHDLRRAHGLFNSLFSQADNARTELLRYELAVPPADIAGAMRLAPGEPALALNRLYRIDDKPIGLAEDWLDPAIARIPRARAETISTEEMMRVADIPIDHAQITIRAETAGAVLGRHLRISPRAAILVHRRRSIGLDGVAREIARLSVCSESYEFVGSTQRLSPSGLGPMESLFDIRTVKETA